MSSETKVGQLLGAEFFGTLLVMLGGPGLMILSDGITPLGIAFGFGVSMAISIGVIGAVANPMFSIALWAARAIPRRELFSDLVGQFLGGLAGGLVIFSLGGLTRFQTGVNGWSTDAGGTAGFAELGVVIAAELLISTVLVVVTLAAIREETPIGTAAAFIGGAYGLAALFMLQLDGAGFNPARSLGTAVFADTNPSALAQVWLFILIPLVAAFAGVFVWLGLDEATIDDTIFDDTVLETASDKVFGDSNDSDGSATV